MGVAALWLADTGVLLMVAAAGIWVGLWARPRWWRARTARRPAAAWAPPPRPIEQAVAHARRLGRLYHGAPEGLARAKVEGIRRAYDDALTECCEELGVIHLLQVLHPGPELDSERTRVERRLEVSGVDLGLAG